MTKKIIATILIITMIMGITWNIFLFKPKKAQAIFGIGDIVIDVLNEVKDWIVDEVPKRIARHMMVRLQQEIARWAQGGFTDENRPFAMTSWKQEIGKALGLASARFIEEFGLTPLCLPLRFTLGERLGLTQFYRVPYTMYAACTLETIVDNITDFYENPSIGLWGWDAWTALAQPQNNIFGAFLLAAERKAEIEAEEKEEKEMQKDIGQGYRPEQDCVEYQEMTDEEMAQCKDDCFTKCEKYIESTYYTKCVDECQSLCKQRQTGICLQYRTKNLGSTIHSAVEKAIGSDIDWLITADEITEMFGIIFSGLFNKLFHGTGLATKPFYRAEPTVAKYQLQYGYYKEYKKAQTPEDIKKLLRDILDNILTAVKRMVTNSYECNKDYQLPGEAFAELAAEILEEESKHLYVGMEGVDLKPDYEVLDNTIAVDNGIAVYGTTWSDIPFDKYPSECSKIAGMKCDGIIHDLPEDLSSECHSCVSKLNEIRINTCDTAHKQCLNQCAGGDEACKTDCNLAREDCNENAYYQAVDEGACSSYGAAYSCLSQAWLVDGTKNRCDGCLKDGALCEGKGDPASKESCLNDICDNFKKIGQPKSARLNPDGSPTNIPGVVSGADFYNKCSLKEIKNSCYVCLKEYFMPADYCEVIYDFINRAFVKYPAMSYERLWWGRFVNITNKQPSGSAHVDKCLESASSPSSIPVALTCRIMPDFLFPDGKSCQNYCDVSDDELKDVTDMKPGESDCPGPPTLAEHPDWGAVWDSGGFHPGTQYGSYLVRKQVKCCAALSGHMPEHYKLCRGITSDKYESPTGGTSCHDGTLGVFVNEGEKAYAFASTNWNIDRKNTPHIDTSLPIEGYKNCVILRAWDDNPEAQKVTVYITEPYCDAYRVMGNHLYWSDIDGDGQFSNSFVDIHPTHEGETLGYCCASSNPDDCPVGQGGGTFKKPPSPGSGEILCTFDLDDPNSYDGTDSTGRPYKVCCGLPNTLENPNTCPAGIPSDLCNEKRHYANGVYIIAVPDQGESKGGAYWCACEEPDLGCRTTCTNEGCSP